MTDHITSLDESKAAYKRERDAIMAGDKAFDMAPTGQDGLGEIAEAIYAKMDTEGVSETQKAEAIADAKDAMLSYALFVVENEGLIEQFARDGYRAIKTALEK